MNMFWWDRKDKIMEDKATLPIVTRSSLQISLIAAIKAAAHCTLTVVHMVK